MNDPEVLHVLLARRDTGVRDDGHRVALVVAGGGMRGAYAGGMVHALDDAGLGGCFDVVYGSSAGAYIGAALLVGDGRGAARIFFENMACRAFADPRRLGIGRPVVSLDHLLDHIMTIARPMPWERLLDVPLRVVATAADDLTPHVLEPRTPAEWKLALRATAAIPFVAGPPVELHGRRWIDGSVTEPLPVPRAIRDGATHVLALVNRPPAEMHIAGPGGPGPARWRRAALDRFAPGLGSITQENARHGPVLAVLNDAGHPSRAGIHLLAVTPLTDEGVRGLTTDPNRVRRATEAGYAAMTAALARGVDRPAPVVRRRGIDHPDGHG